MNFHYFATATCRTLTAAKTGPSLYDICDPLLAVPHQGDAHLSKFYKTALCDPALRLLLRRAGLPELAEVGRREALSAALLRARDDATPDWAAIGAPVAELLDTVKLSHAHPKPVFKHQPAPRLSEIDHAIRIAGAHLLRSFKKNGFLPTYAAFNLIGDPDFGGRELLMAGERVGRVEVVDDKGVVVVHGGARQHLVR